MRSGKAVIVGGGIGGLATALELGRAGFEVDVYERRDNLAEVNTGFLLWSFAIKRLRALGLKDGLDRIGEPLERLVTRSSNGEVLSDISLESLSDVAGAPSYDVHRARLQELLAEATRSGALHLDRRCTQVRENPEGPVAVLEDGEEVGGDLVVGADGVNSVVRRHVVGDVPLRRDEIGVWRGVAEVGIETVRPGEHIRVMGPASLFGAGRLDDRHVRWYAGAIRPVGPERSGGEKLQQQVRERFGGWAEPVPSLIGATEPDAYLYNDAPRSKPLSAWARGSVTLLGDAAHPTLPALATGGGMAIEDAGALRECLEGEVDVPSALRVYERRRRRAASRIQRASVAFERVLAIRDPRLVRVRDAAFRFDSIQRMAIGRLMLGGRLALD